VSRARRALIVATAIWLAWAGYAIFIVAPMERTMRELQRIFYIHAASGLAGLIAFFGSFLASVGYLASRQERWDWLAVALAEAGEVFCTVVLVTGPIWARPVWGIWWTWDARLTLTFVLWLLYAGYLMLRRLSEDPSRRAMLAAVFNVFAFVDVPLVYFSIRWWRTQHPGPVIAGGPGSGLDPRMWHVFLIVWTGLLLLLLVFVQQRYRVAALEAVLEEEECAAPQERALTKQGS